MSNPEILDEIKAIPELLRILTKNPELFYRILDAGLFFEQYRKMKAAYLDESDNGFQALFNFIATMEMPVSRTTGRALVDDTGKNYLWPLASPNPLYARFAEWLHRQYYPDQKQGDIFDQAVNETQPASSDAAQPAPAAPAEKKPYVN